MVSPRRVARYGTTSAYAENTPIAALRGYGRRNYLRVRGEYANPYMIGIEPQELPPRTRRIPQRL